MTHSGLTVVYFVRHADSVYVEGAERERGLTDQGKRDALTVCDLLFGEPIDAFHSSPYQRAVDTIQPLADAKGMDITTWEDLRERLASGSDLGKRFKEAKKKLFEEPDFAYPGGESSKEAALRAARVLGELLLRHRGQSIVIGTHGDIMTLMLNHFDPRFDYAFWTGTTMPDLYRLEFDPADKLTLVTRLWDGGKRQL
ncbi:histidine phosphatase family protein [Paenibacillus ginsengarvi]|uniref:Histidine phosphatase family protein n=1 Tax=Paenibacillus ginsengarvi TaxID=400777 RepID=A0A3B0C1X1_9BACL|nr:histidine phosphatase family protein [Paenibacillus ginsengarvi]RKN79140.1 histidine phosphatase family protein [Paenibacillus ginsengarvi]